MPVSTEHADYTKYKTDWVKVRDSIAGESVIKSKDETYLPRSAGMSGEYASAYEAYKERAHFPLVCAYALQGTLGVILNTQPEFKVPKKLEYILKRATNDGLTLNQLFLNMVSDVLQTGRVPLVVEIDQVANQFRFVKYDAEDFINWKTKINIKEATKELSLAVFKEPVDNASDEFDHGIKDGYTVLSILDNECIVRKYIQDRNNYESVTSLTYFGKPINKIPVFVAGSITNSIDVQPIPLLAVANASVQIYRKEADLSNAEYLSCNPTLVATGVVSEDEIPNIVGSSVLITLSDPTARVFYTTTDVAALDHVAKHIDSLYEEAIRHGVSLLESRKGVEAADALRIRQSVQAATIYSIYLSVLGAITDGLKLMCRWADLDEEEVEVDKPSTLTQDTPDSSLIKNLVEGYLAKVIPLRIIYRYVHATGLIESNITYVEYMKLLEEHEPKGKKENETENKTEGGTISKTPDNNEEE